MSSALSAAESGLNGSQTTLANIAQNLANSNTVGYKQTQTEFQTVYMNQLQGASAPTATSGGTNPITEAAGSAVNLAATQTDFTEGSLQQTGITSNMAITGNGWFIMHTPTGPAYTRAGDFTINAKGQLTDPNGNLVMGWNAATLAAGSQTAANMQPIVINSNASQAPQASTDITLSGNLNSSSVGTTAASTTTKTVPVTVYDSQGNAINAQMEFSHPTAVSGGGVSWTVNLYPQGSTTAYGAATTLTFSSTGTPSWSAAPSWTITPTDGSKSMTLTVPTKDLSGLTSTASATTATASANGYPAGTLSSYTVAANGAINGTFSNGQTEALGQVALAQFSNQQGLSAAGANLYTATANSGIAIVGQPNSGGLGSLVDGSVENSNVNLAQQFTQMAAAQENYSANAKVLTIDQTNRTALVNSVQ